MSQERAAAVVIVGAGLSGLTTAWQLLRDGVDPTAIVLLDGAQRTGGVLRRGRLVGQPVDLGAESLLARRPEALELAAELGLADELEPPAVGRAAIWSRGALHPMPTGHLMGVPGSASSLGSLLTNPELDRLARGLASAGEPVRDDVSVGGWLGERLGAPVVERLVEPLLGGVYAGRVERLSLRAALPALWPAAVTGEPIGPAVQALTTRLSRPGQPGQPGQPGSGPVFVGLRGGVGRLAEVLTERLQAAGVRVRTGWRVTNLSSGLTAGTSGETGWTVSGTGTGGSFSLPARGVVLALPAPACARLLRSCSDTVSAAAELAQVHLASMALIAIALPSGSLPAAPSGEPLSGVLVPAAENRLVKAMTFTSTKWGWVSAGHDLLRLSVGRAGEATALQHPDDELIRLALADAASLLAVPLTPVEAPQLIRWGGGLPQYDVGHLDRIARARTALAPFASLAACGSVWDGVGIPACIRAARDAAARIGAHLAG